MDLRITKMHIDDEGDGIWRANVNGHPFRRQGSVWVADVDGLVKEALPFVADALNRRMKQAMGIRISEKVAIPVPTNGKPKTKTYINVDTGVDRDPGVGLVEQLMGVENAN